jgi:type IV secretory pathway VirB4 component
VGEFEALMSLQKGSGQFLLCKGRESCLQQFPLGGMPDEIAILSTSEDSIAAIDRIPAEIQRDPARFVAEFHRLRREIVAERRQRRQRAETVQ